MEDNNKIIDRKDFGRKIRKCRENLGLTQLELAEEINISQNFLGDIERGIKLPSLETLIRLSNFLKVSIDSLFSASLDNVLCEEDEIYYTEKQLSVIHNIIKNITDNF